ncbi:MAG: hypothetical protein PHD05_02435 [Sphaerochaetaceae bacterium]|nr:hypothetical protein [Sphaerochaetaceae bacterium]
MKLQIITILLIGLLVFGCTQTFNADEIVKTNELVQNFLEKYPNAEIVANKLNVNGNFQLTDLRNICKNNELGFGEYWEVQITDNDANTEVFSLIDYETNEIACIVIKTSSQQTNSGFETQQNANKNCSELGGDLCNAGSCAEDFLVSSESYCCPIQCGVCPEDFDCDDNEKCTKDKCVVKNSEAVCEHEQIVPCANNGVCEQGEITTCNFNGFSGELENDPLMCCPQYPHAVGNKQIESDDCPNTCDDEDSDTGDWYDFEAQECKHISCNQNNNDSSEIIDYKFTSYNDYAKYIQTNLEKEIGIVFTVDGPTYGGNEGIENLRKNGKVYFMMYQHGEWDSIRYWAVEVDAETGELLKHAEVTKGDKEIDYDKLWWIN